MAAVLTGAIMLMDPREEEEETAKSLQFFKLMKAMFSCGGNTRQLSAGVRCQKGNTLDPRKDIS
jgi:hypothetical protein